MGKVRDFAIQLEPNGSALQTKVTQKQAVALACKYLAGTTLLQKAPRLREIQKLTASLRDYEAQGLNFEDLIPDNTQSGLSPGPGLRPGSFSRLTESIESLRSIVAASVGYLLKDTPTQKGQDNLLHALQSTAAATALQVVTDTGRVSLERAAVKQCMARLKSYGCPLPHPG